MRRGAAAAAAKARSSLFISNSINRPADATPPSRSFDTRRPAPSVERRADTAASTGRHSASIGKATRPINVAIAARRSEPPQSSAAPSIPAHRETTASPLSFQLGPASSFANRESGYSRYLPQNSASSVRTARFLRSYYDPRWPLLTYYRDTV